MDSKKTRQTVGNEFSTAKSGVLDLRTAKPKPAHPKPLINRPTFMLPTEVIRRVTAPPVHITFNPVQVSKPVIAHKSFIDGFAYDLLFISLAFFVSLATPYRDWLLLAYLAAALIFRVSSQRIFRSALFCLVAIPVLLQLRRNEAADFFAIFTFYFLCTGVIRAIIELRKP